MKRHSLIGSDFEEIPGGETSVMTLSNDRDVRAEPLDLQGVELILLTFPKFKDGRGFTQARILRQMGFEGDICATGHLIADQLIFAQRAGVSSVSAEVGIDADVARRSLARYQMHYQPAYRGQTVREGRGA